MHITFISIFPDIFTSFLNTSLIAKAIDAGHLSFSLVNPRDFCVDKHQQVDDEIYGGGAGLLMKAQPVIDAVKSLSLTGDNRKLVFPAPAVEEFTQQTAHDLSACEHLIFVCGRYEGIDHRFELRCRREFPEQFCKLSLGKFVTLGGETPAMVMTESVVRLLPGVIKEQASREEESYRPETGGTAIEYPQYTRPETVEGFTVPDVLLSGHHAAIKKRREEHTLFG